MRKNIYLDYAASTPVDKKVLEAMMPYLRRHYGNPSSSHAFGQKTRAAIEQAREEVAEFLHCEADEVIFTSGATEVNTMVLYGVLQSEKPHIVISAIEHESILGLAKQLKKKGLIEVTHVSVTKEGLVRVEDVQKALRPNTVLVSIMYANSEIGTIQPIAEIGEMLRGRRVFFHTDAVQAVNFLDCDVEKLGVDLLTLSGHKIYGSKGVGVLYKRKKVRLLPVNEGGGQEMGLRSGTENVAAIVGLAAALEVVQNPRMVVNNIRIRQLRDKLIKGTLRKIPDSQLTGSLEKRLPNNAHFRFQGVEGRDVVIALDQKGFGISTGSACSEKTQEPSHVLLALGLRPKDALSSVRITIGKHTQLEEIDRVLKILSTSVAALRKGS